MLSRAVQTILGVLLWQANSKGRKKVSTLTPHVGLGSGRMEEDTDRRETGDPALPLPLAIGGSCYCKALSASSQACFSSEWADLRMSLCCSKVSMAFLTYILGCGGEGRRPGKGSCLCQRPQGGPLNCRRHLNVHSMWVADDPLCQSFFLSRCPLGYGPT